MKYAAPLLAALLCVSAVAADKPAAPKPTTIEKILESVPVKERGPKDTPWTDVQCKQYSKALAERLANKELKMPVGKVAEVKEIKGVTYAICGLEKITGGGVTVPDMETRIEVSADEAAKIKIGQAVTVSGTSVEPTVRATGSKADATNEVVYVKLKFKNAKIALK